MLNPKPVILVVDDDEALRCQIDWLLGDRFEVHLASDRASALEELRARSHSAVLLDLHLTAEGGDLHGIEVLEWAARFAPETRVVLLTGESDPQIVRRTLRSGAWDFYKKPIDPVELPRVVERACRLSALEGAPGGDPVGLERFGRMAAIHPETVRLLRAARELAATHLPALILGPAGCGKTTLALEMLRVSGVARPEVIPPGTLPEFPAGADADPPAWVLEQVEQLSPSLQRRLELLLEAGERGGDAIRPPRILATARIDPVRLARRRRFRTELARRLQVARLEIPPLALRPADLLPLAHEVLAEWGRDRGEAAPRLTPEAEVQLRSLLGKAEAKEIAECLREAAVRCGGPWIAADALQPPHPAADAGLRARRARLEAGLVIETLIRRGGNVSQAARDLAVSRPTLHDLMRKHAIDPARFRQG